MSLASQIGVLATRIATEIKAVKASVAAKEPALPGNGTSSQWLRGDRTWADLPFNDRNLIVNADFENLSSPTAFATWSTFWTAGAPTRSIETILANVYSGTKAAKVVINAPGDLQRYGSNVMAVGPGELITVRWTAKASNATLSTQVSFLTSLPTDPAPDFFASGTTTQFVENLATTGYVTYEQVFKIPAGHTQARVYFTANGPAGCTPGTVWLDNTQFLPETSPSGAASHRSPTFGGVPPTNPILGELWWDSPYELLRISDGNGNWAVIDHNNRVRVNTTPPTVAGTDSLHGVLWYDTAASMLKVYDANLPGWRQAYPDDGDTGWINLTLASGYGIQAGTPQYRKIGKWVQVRALVTRGAGWTATTGFSGIATLPVGFRPGNAIYWQGSGQSALANARCDILSSGVIEVTTGSTVPSYVSIEHTFIADL